MTAPRVLFYVQHLLGIGHLARASRVASALVADGFDVTMVTGGRPVAGFPAANIPTVALPSLVAGPAGFTALVNAQGNPADEAYKARRRELLLAALRDLAPDVVILEAFPFGRRQMRFELLPLLEALAGLASKPLLAVSLRDIVQESRRPERARETVELVTRHVDLVLVHGDPAFARLEASFPLAAGIAGRIAYTGLVAGPPPIPAADRFDVVVSAGGGAAGADLVIAAAEAARASSLSWCLITGPNLPAEAAARIGAPPNLAVFPFRSDFPALLASARLSVSQAGYNTVGDILRAGCRSLLVPFAAGGETEQTARALRLEAMGLAHVLPEAGISAGSLGSAVAAALAGPPPPAHRLDLEGAANSARILRSRLRSR